MKFTAACSIALFAASVLTAVVEQEPLKHEAGTANLNLIYE